MGYDALASAAIWSAISFSRNAFCLLLKESWLFGWISASAGVILDAAAEVLLSRRTGVTMRGVAAVAAVAARARLRENILYAVVGRSRRTQDWKD